MPVPVRLLVPAAALVLLTGCAGSDVDSAAAPSPVPSAPALSAPAPSAPAPSAPASAAPAPSPTQEGTVIDVTYAGGQVTGVDSRVPVDVGERVLLRVTSDVAEEIHVHGYDLYVDVPAGGTGEVEFVADQAGSWEVELHDAGRPLFQLRVS